MEVNASEEDSRSFTSSDTNDEFNDRDDFIEAEKILPRAKLSPMKQESLELMDKLKHQMKINKSFSEESN